MLVVISHPRKIHNEAEAINALFEAGMELFHLRKPGWESPKVEKLINKIDPKYYNKIVIHKHIEVFEKYDLKGFHFKNKNKEVADKIHDIYTKSYTAQSFESILKESKRFSYMFLTPIYKSISKDNHEKKYTYEEITEFFATNEIKPKVLALGGVTYKKIDHVREMGFDGIAVLGAFWQPYKDTPDIDWLVERFNTITEKCKIFDE